MNSIERGRVRKITVIGAGQGEADGARGLRRGREEYEDGGEQSHEASPAIALSRRRLAKQGCLFQAPVFPGGSAWRRARSKFFLLCLSVCLDARYTGTALRCRGPGEMPGKTRFSNR